MKSRSDFSAPLKKVETAGRPSNTNAYKWARKYHVFTVGVKSAVLVIHPKKYSAIDVTAMTLSSLQQPRYAERLFIDLWKIHKEDHCKGITFFYCVRDTHGNVMRDICKMFTNVCPQCISVLSCQSSWSGGLDWFSGHAWWQVQLPPELHWPWCQKVTLNSTYFEVSIQHCICTVYHIYW